MNIFDLFGVQPVSDKKVVNKNITNSKNKGKTIEGKQKKSSEILYSTKNGVEIISGYYDNMFLAPDTFQEDKISEKAIIELFYKEHNEYHPWSCKLKKLKCDSHVKLLIYLTYNKSLLSDKNKLSPVKEQPCRIVYAGFETALENESIDLSTISEIWSNAYPEFADAKYYYNVYTNIIMPIFSDKNLISGNYTYPLNISIFGKEKKVIDPALFKSIIHPLDVGEDNKVIFNDEQNNETVLDEDGENDNYLDDDILPDIEEPNQDVSDDSCVESSITSEAIDILANENTLNDSELNDDTDNNSESNEVDKNDDIIPSIEEPNPDGVGISSDITSLTADDTSISATDVQKIANAIYPELEGSLNLYYIANELFVVPGAKSSAGNAVEPKKPKETLYSTEGTTISLIFTKYHITPEQFNGKKQVSKKTILKFLVDNGHTEFESDDDNAINIRYDKKTKFIIPHYASSRKGVTEITSIQQLESEMKKDYSLCVFNDGTNLFRIEKNSIGIFKVLMNGCFSEYDKFIFNLPKIPKVLIDEIYSFFLFVSNYKREAAAQLFYDTENNNYIVYYPEQTVLGVNVVFERNFEMETCGKYILVMDLHSHHILNSVFSQTDDDDERETRLYMVFGNLSRNSYSYSLRARTGHNFIYLNTEDIIKDLGKQSMPNIYLVPDEAIKSIKNKIPGLNCPI